MSTTLTALTEQLATDVARLTAERDALARELKRLTDAKGLRFAGFFAELPSAMGYKIWEQGGYAREAGEVALYEYV